MLLTRRNGLKIELEQELDIGTCPQHSSTSFVDYRILK